MSAGLTIDILKQLGVIRRCSGHEDEALYGDSFALSCASCVLLTVEAVVGEAACVVRTGGGEVPSEVPSWIVIQDDILAHFDLDKKGGKGA